jgi:hypothetical protein
MYSLPPNTPREEAQAQRRMPLRVILVAVIAFTVVKIAVTLLQFSWHSFYLIW